MSSSDRKIPLTENMRKDWTAAEGVSLNQFINVAVAEKVSAVRAEAILRVAPAGFLQILHQARKLKPIS